MRNPDVDATLPIHLHDQATMRNLVSRIRAYDQRRASFPGEHLIVAAIGSSLLRSAARRRSGVGRLLALVAGGALLARAASGRDGLARLSRLRDRGPVASRGTTR